MRTPQAVLKTEGITGHRMPPPGMVPRSGAEGQRSTGRMPAVDPSQSLRLVWDGPHLDDYSIKFKPYEWTIGP